jgi:hypothetical protein
MNTYSFAPDDLRVLPRSSTLIAEFSAESLERFGYPIKDESDLLEISEAIFRLMNENPNLAGLSNMFKRAGHTSMSTGDYIKFRSVGGAMPDIDVAYVCANAGWKVIEDFHTFSANAEQLSHVVRKLPTDVINVMAVMSEKDPKAFREKLIKAMSGLQCENHCPKCNSDDISSIDTCFSDVVYQKLTCNKCGCEFKEYFTYSDTEIDGEQ